MYVELEQHNIPAMNYETAHSELTGKPPEVSFKLLSIESVAMLVIAYLMVQFFA